MRTVTVQQGDTLSAIALREYGDASKWPRLWQANETTIRSTQKDGAKARNMTGPDWIFPGTVLKVP